MTNKEIEKKNLENAVGALKEMLDDVKLANNMGVETAFLGGYHSALNMAANNIEMALVLRDACEVISKEHYESIMVKQ
jgi:hypothetical protein